MGRIIKLLLYFLAYQVLPLIAFKVYLMITAKTDAWQVWFDEVNLSTTMYLSLMAFTMFTVHLWLGGYIQPSTLKIRHSFIPVAILPAICALCLIPLSNVLPEWLKLDDLNAEYFASITRHPAGILLIVVVGPVLEECLFRGAILENLLQQTGRQWTSILISATLFGIIHLNPAQILPAIICGFAIGWIYTCTRSLWPAIIYHIVNNAIAAWSFSLLPDEFAITTYLGPLYTTVLMVLSLLSAGFCLWLTKRYGAV